MKKFVQYYYVLHIFIGCSIDLIESAVSKHVEEGQVRSEEQHGRGKTDSEISDMFHNLLIDYDIRLKPNYVGDPVEISVDATILSFTNLDALKTQYTCDMFFRQQWNDYRLAHDLNETLTIIVGTKHPSDIIWTPDTVFINSVTSAMHDVTVNNHKLDIYPNGTVFWGTRVTVSPSCYLYLKAYPMDKQSCMFEIVSYAYTSDQLTYKWKEPGILIIDNSSMAQFELINHNTVKKEYEYVAGNYTVLIGKFHFKRLMGFALLQIYIPSIAVVSVSWISLWIRRGATPARITLGITTLLTISTIWSAVNATLPRVNYVKAIDIFLMTSFCFVICTLLEYAIVLNSASILELWKKSRKKSKKKDDDRFLIKKASYLNEKSFFANGQKTRGMTAVSQKGVTKKEKDFHNETEELANWIEIVARVFFPLAYVTFNICYWATFLQEKTMEPVM